MKLLQEVIEENKQCGNVGKEQTKARQWLQYHKIDYSP